MGVKGKGLAFIQRLRQPEQLPGYADFGRGHLFLMIRTYVGENIVVLI